VFCIQTLDDSDVQEVQQKSGSGSGSGTEERQVQGETNLNTSEQREIQRISTMRISKVASSRGNEPTDPNMYPICHQFNFLYQIFRLIIAFN
jgi:hypothetical protein